MDALTFKTNIKCSGCVATVTPFLNKVVGENNWKVDVANPEKLLRIEADQSLTSENVIKAVEEAGYKAEVVK